jgi:hypothetical protein
MVIFLAVVALKHARISKLCEANMPSSKVPHPLILNEKGAYDMILMLARCNEN